MSLPGFDTFRSLIESLFRGPLLRRLLLACLAILAGQCLGDGLRVLPTRATHNDFAHYYASSRLLLDGQPVYGSDLSPVLDAHGFNDIGAGEQVGQATNPPVLLWLFAPLAAVEPRTAFALWLLGQLACLAGILGLTLYLLRGRISTEGGVWIVVLAIASPAVYYHLYYSQVQLLLALMVLGAFALLQSGRGRAACALICLAGMIKLFPLALLPWFLLRSERPRQNAVFSGLLAAGLFLASGPLLWLSFWTHAKPLLFQWAVASAHNFTAPSLLMRLGSIFEADLPGSFSLACFCGSLVGAAILGGAYWLCWKSDGDLESQFCLLTIAMLVGGMTCWIHYDVFLIFPLAALGAVIRAEKSAWRPAQQAWLALLVLGVFSHFLLVRTTTMEYLAEPIWQVLVCVTPLYAACGLGWTFAQRLRRNVGVTPAAAEQADVSPATVPHVLTIWPASPTAHVTPGP
ncbi:glycosyltransferase family 87 protein [Lignipirellula cremea]|uniref:DUF2029 domain-containing protein n=1 Tax=Lignipirellula cremea TaxID=2528010 RepID=A0A518E2R4_9BACT|nr:glycosyltransferase family 87 protein [Lignipirellula cremea]QDU98380.1 hypothetical protein Pla8534_62480 [Lignipirellula cremea]